MSLLLLWAAAPALALSLWLLQIAGAPRSAQALQLVVASVAVAAHVVAARSRGTPPAVDAPWLPVVLAASLFIPLLSGGSDAPARWLTLGSVRLYLPPVVLPIALLFLGARPVAALRAASIITATVALMLQPDGSQLTAFAVATLAILATSRAQRLLRATLAAILLAGAVAAWRIPDPLAPVSYVEGVFSVAAGVSPFALLAAVVSAVLPVLALAWTARATHSSGTFAVAVYYAALFALAPLQVTPVPLLGFGAGPILGYFLAAGAVSRRQTSAA